jgi:hypothetical protein
VFASGWRGDPKVLSGLADISVWGALGDMPRALLVYREPVSSLELANSASPKSRVHRSGAP